MTLSTTTNRVAYVGNGVTTAFAVPFQFFDAADLIVKAVVIATGVESLKALTTDYTVSGGAGSTGTVTALVAPASTVKWMIYRDRTRTQALDLVAGDPLPAENTESQLDKIVMQVQRAHDLASRSLRQPEGDTTAIDYLPNVVDRASMFLAFDSDGDPIASEAPVAGTGTPVSVFGATLIDDASAADAQTTLGVPPNERSITGTTGLLGGGTLAADRTITLDPSYLRGYLSGLTISNNAGDATNDIDIAVGIAVDSTRAAFMVLAAALTKRLDAAWAVGTNQGGLDTGAIANTTYHVHLIRRPDTGVIDVLFSTSPTAPTMPTNYTQFRRIGSFVRASAAILPFKQRGDFFELVTPVADISGTNPGTSEATRTLASMPTGISAVARVLHVIDNGDATALYSLLSALDTTNVAPAITASQTPGSGTAAGQARTVGAQLDIATNTSAQIRSRVSYSSANVTEIIRSLGWTDDRGRVA
jgi:hypothetical protein